MKKILIRIVIALFVLVIVAVVALSLCLDGAIKKGVETFGPRITKVPIKLDGVRLSLLSGAGSVKGLEVGNPEGYTSSNSITLGSASVALSPGSLLSDKIVVQHIRVVAPDITIEGTPYDNNLTKILDNVKAASGSAGTKESAPSEAGGPGKKVQIDEFLLTGAKIHYVVGGQTYNLEIPEIKLTGLGTGPDGITAADVTEKVLAKLIEEVGPALANQAGKLGKQAVDSAVGEATKKLGDLLHKK